MTKFIRAVAAIATSAALCGCSGGGTNEGAGGSTGTASSTSGDSFMPPAFVSIRLKSAVVRPWDTSNEQWDGPAVSQSDIDALTQLLTDVNPYAGVTAWLAQFGSDATSPPDAIGTAYLYVNGTPDPTYDSVAATEDDNFENTFTPPFVDNPGWDHVPVERNMRFGVKLLDEDLAYNDSIGTVELNYDDVIQALKANQVTPIQTDDQDVHTILFVELSAVPEP